MTFRDCKSQLGGSVDPGSKVRFVGEYVFVPLRIPFKTEPCLESLIVCQMSNFSLWHSALLAKPFLQLGAAEGCREVCGLCSSL